MDQNQIHVSIADFILALIIPVDVAFVLDGEGEAEAIAALGVLAAAGAPAALPQWGDLVSANTLAAVPLAGGLVALWGALDSHSPAGLFARLGLPGMAYEKGGREGGRGGGGGSYEGGESRPRQ